MSRKLILSVFLILAFAAEGLFAVSQLPKISVKIVDQSGTPLQNARVMLVGFPEGTGEIEGTLTRVAITGSEGLAEFSGLDIEHNSLPVDYMIIVSKHGYRPTVKEQLKDFSNIPTYRLVSTTQNLDLTGMPIHIFQDTAMTAGALGVFISTNSVSLNDILFAEVKHAMTGELVALGIDVVDSINTDYSHCWFLLGNVPVAFPNTYKLSVHKGNSYEGGETLVSAQIYQNQISSQTVEMGFFSNTSGEGDVTVDVTQVAFEGVVVDESNNPITNCSIELKDFSGGNAYFRTLTDASGRFMLFKEGVTVGSNYGIQASKLGYKSFMDDNSGQDGYIYNGERILLDKYTLQAATGVVKGYIKLNGSGFADAEVRLENEWEKFWYNSLVSTDNFQSGGGSFMTRVRGDGYYEFVGVPEGKYDLWIYHPLFSASTTYWHGEGAPEPSQSYEYNYDYNKGQNQRRDVHIFEGNEYRYGDDRIIVVTPHNDLYACWADTDTAGLAVDKNQDLNVDISLSLVTNATITGTLTFSGGVTPDKTKFSIVAHPIDPGTRRKIEWEGGGTSYFAAQDDITVGAGYLNYTIRTSTGTYFIELRSDSWVPVRGYNLDATLVSAGSTWKLPTVSMVTSGRLEGKIKLPTGAYFQAKRDNTTTDRARIKVRGVDLYYEFNKELEEWSPDPTKFVFDALPPGKYILWIEIKRTSNSNSNETTLYPTTIVPSVRVVPGETTYVEAQVKKGVLCQPLAPIPPEEMEVDYSSRGTVTQNMIGIIGFPAEVVLKGSTLRDLIRNQGALEDFYVYFFDYDYMTKKWRTDYILPGKYNFYMCLMRMFGSKGDTMGGDNNGGPELTPDEYITIFGRAENINIKSEDLAPGATFQIPIGAGVMGAGVLTGKFKAANFLLPEDGSRLKGKLDEFQKYTPTVMLYDMEGKLRAYSSAVISSNETDYLEWWMDIMYEADVDKINALVNSDDPGNSAPVHYYLDNVPFGKYILVAETVNYPPIMKIVTVSTGTTTVNLNFDEDALSGAKITGTVVDTNGNPLADANVTLTHRLVKRKVSTDENGEFLAPGLPSGGYRIDVTKSGYAMGGEKVSLGIDDKRVTVTLKAATAQISGKVYVRGSGFSKKSVYTGAKLVIYNETENVANPKKYNPAVASKTENDGAYRIPDIILANTYYVYAFVPERPVYFRRVYISSNSMTGIDFDIMPSTPTLKVTMKRTESQNVFRFIIESPRPLVAPPECYYSPGAVFNALRKVRALPTAGAKNTFTVDVEIPSTSEEEYYTLSIKAQYGMTDYMTEELNFSQKFLAKAKKEVADELAEGGSILIDDERSDNTEVMLDPGTLTSDEMVNLPIGGFLTALPNFKMSKMGRDISTLIDSAMQGIAASEVYEIGLEKAQVNKSFDVTLNYDRNKVTEEDIADLKIYKYNDATGKWEAMSGIMSLDPLTGTISVETDTLLPADAQKSAPKTVVKNGVFAINKAVSATQSGAFAVFKQDPNTAKIYAGSEFTVINFPNPFDLKTKTVNMQDVNSAPSQTITGTMLKYTLPANKSGKIKLYIYNLAGELVRELDEGDKTGGFYYYTEWDGRNDNGEECASGIYFLIAKRNDSKISSKPHKIAILK